MGRPEMEQGEQAPDAALEALYAEPIRVVRPSRQAVPFIFASPHSGRIYPASFIEKSRLNPTALRRSEDAFVDELFAGAALDCAAPFIAARFPRAYLDANRLPGELDAGMFEGRLGLDVDTASPRVNAGLGVIPRIVRDGAEIYRDKLAPAEAAQRLARLYRPYHAALLQLVEETLASFGTAVVVDCHSMPSAAAVPDVVLGDRYGVSATPQLMRSAERAFEHLAFTVARNIPYAGGYTTHLYGKPAQGIHALQVEINRALYLDEERIVPASRFDDVRARIAEVLARLTAVDLAFLRPYKPFGRIQAAE